MTGIHFEWQRKGEAGGRRPPLLQIRNLTVRVGIRRILNNLDLEVFGGDHVRIAGPNGSGKSTLLNAIAGIPPARVESGSILFDGRDLTDLSSHERAVAGISYMRQLDNIYPSLGVDDNLRLAVGEQGPELLAKRFPAWRRALPPAKPAGALSGGQRKKLAFAMTILAGGKKLLLLDEPRAGVDEDELFDHAGLTDRTIISIEH